LIAAAAGVQLLSAPAGLHVVSAIALLLACEGIALLLGGREAGRAAVLPIAVLALAVPLPVVDRLAPPLAAAAAHGAAVAATTVGAGVERVGAQLSVGGGSFVVGAPCSGLRSLVSLATLAAVLAGVSDGPATRRMAIVAAAVPLALLANWVRLTGLILAAEAVGPQRGLALFHDVSGPLLFALAAVALLAAHRRAGLPAYGL
jgi:exosortase